MLVAASDADLLGVMPNVVEQSRQGIAVEAWQVVITSFLEVELSRWNFRLSSPWFHTSQNPKFPKVPELRY